VFHSTKDTFYITAVRFDYPAMTNSYVILTRKFLKILLVISPLQSFTRKKRYCIVCTYCTQISS